MTYSVGIIIWRVLKVKQMAMDILERDGQKQYSLLYNYEA